jgi:hypothetical protein
VHHDLSLLARRFTSTKEAAFVEKELTKNIRLLGDANITLTVGIALIRKSSSHHVTSEFGRFEFVFSNGGDAAVIQELFYVYFVQSDSI